MIYLTGDTHGGLDMGKLSRKSLKHFGIAFNENDFLIITGDFGFPFTPKDIEEYENGVKGEYNTWIRWFAERRYKVLFVDGNHDNHDWWSLQPVTQMFGGSVQVHPHARNVIHLMRGEVYEIEGRKIFTFGGAASADKAYRTEGFNWWPGEEPSVAETEHALENLERAGNKVDLIITHTMPETVIRAMPRFNYWIQPCKTAQFLDRVLERTQYRNWFCGHFHIDLTVPHRRLAVLYETVHSLDELDRIITEDGPMYPES